MRYIIKRFGEVDKTYLEWLLMFIHFLHPYSEVCDLGITYTNAESKMLILINVGPKHKSIAIANTRPII